MQNKRRLIIFDTSNYVDFPVGGQLTSIRNFIRYLAEFHSCFVKNILLIGITNKQEEVGKITYIKFSENSIEFLPVAYINKDLNNVKKSSRLEYLKGLIKFNKKFNISTEDLLYIHSPEVFIYKQVLHRKCFAYVFSHGSFFQFKNNIRFFNKYKFINKILDNYFIYLIKNSDCIFVLDEKTKNEYIEYSKNIVKVSNSIVCKEFTKHMIDYSNIKLLYVGRLSKTKHIDEIIIANNLRNDSSLTIVGAGEEYEKLVQMENRNTIFIGNVSPEKVKSYMENSNILIMNSYNEGIPMTILEAKNLSLPIISTDVGGIGEVVEFGVDSEKTDGTHTQINIAIDKVLSNYELYCNKSYENSKKYDYRVVNQRIFDEINKILMWI